MSDEKCPSILGAQGVTSGTWVVTDANELICLETGNALRVADIGTDVRMDTPGSGVTYVLWQFNSKEDCTKKFEWLKSILIGTL